MTIREARFRFEQQGFRSKAIIVVTALLDPTQTTKQDLACLYRARWNNELDLRSIKSTMQMDTLRCKKPDLVPLDCHRSSPKKSDLILTSNILVVG